MAISPMMEHYLQVKEQNKDAIIFYRLGDFYEMFFEDAELVSSLLGITLTGKDCGLEKRAPMCGVPFHSADTYISRLLENGYKVAICEQLSEPQKGKMVERDVVRIITPGTVMEEDILTANNNFIVSVFMKSTQKIGVSWLDLSTGEFNMTTYSGVNAMESLNDLLISLKPSEIICSSVAFSESENLLCVKTKIVPKFYQYIDFCYELKNATQTVLNQLKIGSLAILDCVGKEDGICACGGLLEYISQTQKRKLDHINKLNIQRADSYLYMDANAKLNLELKETIFERKQQGSLFWVLNKTVTTMGKRLLLNWLDKPLRNSEMINERLNSVEELIKNNIARDDLHEILRTFADVERLCGRLSYGSIGPRGCVEIQKSLSKLPQIKNYTSNFESSLLKRCNENIFDFSKLTNMLISAFKDEVPISAKDGNFIREGFNKELDEQCSIMRNGKQWIANLEAKERDETGIKLLKIKYNNILGYFFEAPISQKDKIPLRFERKQTLANCERYTSKDLTKLAEAVVNAETNINLLEQKIFNQIKDEIKSHLEDLQNTARQIAILDVLISFANISIQNKYVKPTINDKIKYTNIIGGRHPVVEKISKNQRFIPNDTTFSKDCHTMIITGPNMAGKSTYMRQVALITIMAHMGCFVPANKAEIAICDRIFTRIGAADNLGMGQSTFMVEMIEVATVTQNATEKSLLILDEIGRGTSTYDGLSIAWAVIEYITKKIKACTLFATHYHEITALEGSLEGVKNYHIAIKEYDNNIIFLHNILPGSSNRSFGIEVATLAGINSEVVERAKEVLHSHEQIDLNGAYHTDSVKAVSKNLSDKNSKIIESIKNIDINVLTPLEAISKLAELKDKIKE